MDSDLELENEVKLMDQISKNNKKKKQNYVQKRRRLLNLMNFAPVNRKLSKELNKSKNYENKII